MHDGAGSRYYLGVDGGQSSTTALIADEHGRVLGAGFSGPCNHVRDETARSKFASVVGDCLSQAAEKARLGAAVPEFAAACLGFSGGIEDKESYSRELIQSQRFKFTHDAEIALTGATRGEPGIIVIAGTGSMAFGRNRAGQTARAGGWGFIYGDEGGAFDLVRRALRAALQYEEGWGPPTSLRSQLLDETGASKANELLHRLYRMDRHQIAAFAPVVTRASEEGDAVARNIIDEAVNSLAWYVGGVFRHLFQSSDSVMVAPVGGVFRSEQVRSSLDQKLRATLQLQITAPALSPAAGALIEALRLDGNGSTLTNIPVTKS